MRTVAWWMLQNSSHSLQTTNRAANAALAEMVVMPCWKSSHELRTERGKKMILNSLKNSDRQSKMHPCVGLELLFRIPFFPRSDILEMNMQLISSTKDARQLCVEESSPPRVNICARYTQMFLPISP